MKQKKDIQQQTENSRHSRPPVSCSGKRAAWLLVLGLIVCAAVVGFFGPKSLLPADKESQETRPRSDSADLSTAVPTKSELTPEQEVAALKKQEQQLVRTLMRDFPDSEDPIVLMGNVQLRHGNAAEALRFWGQGLQRDPNRADVYKAMGWFVMGKEQYEQAIAHWRKALQIDPQMPGVHNGIARALMGLGKHAEAIEELQKDIQISPDSSFSYFLLGQEYLQQKEYEKAKANYEKAISLEPNLTNSYYGLFTVCARLKLRAKAQEYMAIFKKLKAEDMKVLKDRNDAFNDLLDMRKGAAETYLRAGHMYRAGGNMARAEQLLKRAAELDPKDSIYLMELASLYQMSNRIADALQMHKRISEMEPENPVCHLNIGIFSARLKQFAEAEEAFRKVIALAPASSHGYRSLAQLYLETGRNLPEARELAQKAVAREPIAANYFVLSWACDKNADKAGALSAIEQALKLDLTNPRYKRVYELIRKRD